MAKKLQIFGKFPSAEDTEHRLLPEVSTKDAYFILRVNANGDGYELVNLARDMYMQTWVIPYLLPRVDESHEGFVARVNADGSWEAYDLYGNIEESLDRIIAIQNTFVGLTPLPEVATADNGKIAQAENGEWVPKSVEESAVKDFVDDYISSALGDEY